MSLLGGKGYSLAVGFLTVDAGSFRQYGAEAARVTHFLAHHLLAAALVLAYKVR